MISTQIAAPDTAATVDSPVDGDFELDMRVVEWTNVLAFRNAAFACCAPTYIMRVMRAIFDVDQTTTAAAAARR